jgi:prophage antirepressor-like protein
MHDLQVFNFEGFRRVRVILRDGEPWFVAKDVCDILGLGNPSEALRNLDEDEVFGLRNSEAKTLGFRHATTGVNLVSESGLYTLIMRSNKPEAKAFRRWVTHEVLPAIRKTGRYVIPKETHTKAEIEKAGKAFFMDCYREGGVERYLEKRYPDKYRECFDPRNRVDPDKLLSRGEKRWLEEAESAQFLVREGCL